MCLYKKRYPLILGSVLTAILSFSGCSDVQRSSRHYMPLVAQTFPPKPANVHLPVLKHPPKQSHLVIGKMVFETDEGPAFIYKSLQYNARKNGADAIVMRLTPKRPDLMDAFVEAQMIKY